MPLTTPPEREMLAAVTRQLELLTLAERAAGYRAAGTVPIFSTTPGCAPTQQRIRAGLRDYLFSAAQPGDPRRWPATTREGGTA